MMEVTGFHFVGDMAHLAAIVLLPIKLQWSSASGVSLKTQEIYLVVFLARYLDLCVHSVSLYNSAMKIIFISYTAMAIAMLRWQPSLRAAYDKSMDSSCATIFCAMDSFQHWSHAVVPSFVLAMVIHVWHFGYLMSGFFVFRTFLWTFSELLEPLAIAPQLLVLRRCRNPGILIWCYVSLMAVYRALYVLVWVWAADDHPWIIHHHVLLYTAMAQTLIYVIFFMDYVTRAAPHLPVHSDDIMEVSSSVRQGLLQSRPSVFSSVALNVDSLCEGRDEEAQQLNGSGLSDEEKMALRAKAMAARSRRTLGGAADTPETLGGEDVAVRDRAVTGTCPI